MELTTNEQAEALVETLDLIFRKLLEARGSTAYTNKLRVARDILESQIKEFQEKNTPQGF